jgi:hypothetical protein
MEVKVQVQRAAKALGEDDGARSATGNARRASTPARTP